jgi:hypothetical protein
VPEIKLIPCFEGVEPIPSKETLTIVYRNQSLKIPFIIPPTGFAVQVRVYTKRESFPDRSMFGWTRCGDAAFTESGTKSLRTSSFQDVCEYPQITLTGIQPRTVQVNIPDFFTREFQALSAIHAMGEVDVPPAPKPCSLPETTQTFSPHIFGLFRGPVVTERWIRERTLEVLAVRGYVEFPLNEHAESIVAHVLVMHTNTRPYVRDSILGFRGSRIVDDDSDEPTMTMGLPGDCEDSAMSTYHIIHTILKGRFTDPLVKRVQATLKEMGEPFVIYGELEYPPYKNAHVFCILKGKTVTVLDGVLDATTTFHPHQVAPEKLAVIASIQDHIHGKDIPWIWTTYHTKTPLDGTHAIHKRCFVAFKDGMMYAILHHGHESTMAFHLEEATFQPVMDYPQNELEQERRMLELVERPLVRMDSMYDGYVDAWIPRFTAPTFTGNRVIMCAYNTTKEKALRDAKQWNLPEPRVYSYGFGFALVFPLGISHFQ